MNSMMTMMTMMMMCVLCVRGSSAALAEIYCELGTKNDLKLAQKCVDKAIKLTPEEPYPYKVQALILAEQTIEKYDEALEYCDKGLKFAPEDGDLLSTERIDLS